MVVSEKTQLNIRCYNLKGGASDSGVSGGSSANAVDQGYQSCEDAIVKGAVRNQFYNIKGEQKYCKNWSK